MTVTDDLQANRAALVMINPAPYNAEAPPAGMAEEITPTDLHYVRSNFPLPTHDGTLEITGAVENPITLTLEDLRALPAHEHAVTLECAGNGRLEMRPLPTGEPWGDYAVSTARWKGALLSDVLALANPSADGTDVKFEGADHGAYHLKPVLPDTSRIDLAFERALPLALAADPAAQILIAYEMNGEPLRPRPRRPLPRHRAPLVRRRVGQMAQTDRSPDRAVRRRVPDRSLHVPMAGPAAGNRQSHAGPGAHHRPAGRVDPRRRALHRPRQGLVRAKARSPASRSA